MYICRECKAKYKTKVDYCECGNNTFDYVADEEQRKSSKYSGRGLTLEQKSELVSRIFFALCIIISIIVLSIPIKSSSKASKQDIQKPIDERSIPDINKIWNDTPMYQPVSSPKQIQPQEQNPLDKIRQELPLTSAPIENKKISQAEVQKKNIVSAKPKTQTAPKQYQNGTITRSTSSGNKKPTKLDEAPLYKEPQKPQKPLYNPNSAEMLRYKNNLRSALFTQFAVGSISGSGECSVQFALNKNGRLVERKFSHESSNKSLNDAVYYMLMSVPQFDPPPSEYNGQTIHMNFKIDNGNYEISIH